MVRLSQKLKEVGSPDGKMRFIAAVGDAGMVYVSDCRTRWDRGEGRAFYADVADGLVVITPAPLCRDLSLMQRLVRDTGGGLWLPVQRGPTDVYRLSGDFTEEHIDYNRAPLLRDKSGCVWLGPEHHQAGTAFRLWYDEKLSKPIVIPNEESQWHWKMISDRPGSVYVFGVSAIYHLTAEDPDRPAHYTLKKQYRADCLNGQVESAQYSSLGYAVVCSRNADTRRSELHLIRLPEHD